MWKKAEGWVLADVDRALIKLRPGCTEWRRSSATRLAVSDNHLRTSSKKTVVRNYRRSQSLLRLWVTALLVIASLWASIPVVSSAQKAQNRFPGWKTNFEKRSIDLGELLPGGPPKDAIPAINDPQFVSPGEAANWIKPQEPVISVVVNNEARAYPLQILIWHEMVNDRIGDVPLLVTFCPLCYSALVFDRRAAGREFQFGVSGFLRNSDMVMFDRESESLWQQFTAEAIVGDLTGAKLEPVPSQIISFKQFSAAYPKGHVLSRETGYHRSYGRNPYEGYDDISRRPFLYRGKIDSRLAPMEKIIGLTVNGTSKAYPSSITRKRRVIQDMIEGHPVIIFHADGAVSALDQSEISTSRQVGSIGVYDPRVDGQLLSFAFKDGQFVDSETGSEWDITGRAIRGKMEGRALTPLAHGYYFAFAWFAFKPDSQLYRSK